MLLFVDKIDYFLVDIPLRFSVEHALAKRKANTSGFLIITSQDGRRGVGEFLCREYVMGENVEECVRYLNEKIKPRLIRARIDNPLDMIRDLWSDADNRGKQTMLCAVDLALLDLWSKTNSKSIRSLFPSAESPTKNEIQYSAVYPFAKGFKFTLLDFFYRTVKRMQDIKVKGTGILSTDQEYLTKIKKTFSYPIKVRMDLNGSLAPDKADEYFTRMTELGVHWYEQPFQKNDWQSASRFQKKYPDIILCADESICTVAELEKAAHEGAFRAMNIRLGKNGGLFKSLEMHRRAIELGLKTQLGCLVGESSILSYAGLHFAAMAQPLEHSEGCFGTYLTKWDVIKPSLAFTRGGKVSLKRLPQYGIVPSFDVSTITRRAFRQRGKP